MEKEKKIIALAANIGAGKSFVSDYISKKINTENIRYSQTLSEILGTLNLENDRKNLQNLSLGLRNIFGENILEKVVLEKIKNSEKNIIILDGVRREEDFNLIKKKYSFNLIFIEVDEKIRQERINLRNEKSDDKNICQKILRKRDGHNSETKEDLKNISNFILNNNETLENLEKDVNKILENILEK